MDTTDHGTRLTSILALAALMSVAALAACSRDLPTANDAEKICYEIDGQIYCK